MNIYNEDCLETLNKIKDDSIDCVITSPPYNMNLRIRNGKYCSRQIVKELSTKYSNFNDNLPIDEYNKFHSKVLKELLRVSKVVFYNIQIVTGSKRSIFKMIGDFNEQLKDIIVWNKGVSQPAMHQQVLNKQTELILVFETDYPISRQFKYANFKRGTLSDIWNIKRENTTNKNHSATFPLNLIRKILINFTNENNIIYDPFMGTGTTAIACLIEKRKFIGSEIDKDYCNVALKRIEQHKAQIRLF
tara:strand:- start:2 stop:739 length:738 start_codon:yes stop_codon:yes gene_type:complete